MPFKTFILILGLALVTPPRERGGGGGGGGVSAPGTSPPDPLSACGEGEKASRN
jgi:hypothetical protein